MEKESNKLKKEAEGTEKKLRELGDIQNWAEVLERDLRVLEETVTLGEGGDVGWSDEEEWEGDEEGDGEEGDRDEGEGGAAGKKVGDGEGEEREVERLGKGGMKRGDGKVT